MQSDIENLARALGRTFTEAERQDIQTVQERSYRWTFIGSGVTHTQVVEIFKQMSPAQQQSVEVAEIYCQSSAGDRP